LTPELLAALRTPQGAALLARAAALAGDPFAAQKLRDSAPLELAAAAVEQVRLRTRAAGRFSRAAEMWFAPGLLEQASGDLAAARHAACFPVGSVVADLCCGLGGDAVALAARGPVRAVDRDPLAVALTAANAAALGQEMEVSQAELPAGAPEAEFAWADPGRREAGRTRRLAGTSPPFRVVLALLVGYAGAGVKLAPATPDADLDGALAGVPHRREFVSVHGECRELLLWFGSLIGAAPAAARRAVLLPAGAVLEAEPAPWPAARAPGEWLVEPDAAVIRAGLVGNLARELDAAPLDDRLAYLGTAREPRTPFGTTYRLLERAPFSEKALTARLRALGAGDVVLKTRGFAAPPEALRPRLRPVLKQGDPARCPVVFVTRIAGRAVMLLGERLGA